MHLTTKPFSFTNNSGIYFVTFPIVFWIDVFIRKIYKDIFVESLKYCIQEKGLILHAWVIMSSHVHLIISVQDPEKHKLSDIVRDMKKFTSRKLISAIEMENESRKEWMLDKFRFAASKNSRNHFYQFWAQNSHAEELYSNKFQLQKLNYIHHNPVKEGWVNEPDHYSYSSAGDYAGKKGMLDIVFIG